MARGAPKPNTIPANRPTERVAGYVIVFNAETKKHNRNDPNDALPSDRPEHAVSSPCGEVKCRLRTSPETQGFTAPHPLRIGLRRSAISNRDPRVDRGPPAAAFYIAGLCLLPLRRLGSAFGPAFRPSHRRRPRSDTS